MTTDTDEPTPLEWVLTRLNQLEGVIAELKDGVQAAIANELEAKAGALKGLEDKLDMIRNRMEDNT